MYYLVRRHFYAFIHFFIHFSFIFIMLFSCFVLSWRFLIFLTFFFLPVVWKFYILFLCFSWVFKFLIHLNLYFSSNVKNYTMHKNKSLSTPYFSASPTGFPLYIFQSTAVLLPGNWPPRPEYIDFGRTWR